MLVPPTFTVIGESLPIAVAVLAVPRMGKPSTKTVSVAVVAVAAAVLLPIAADAAPVITASWIVNVAAAAALGEL